MKRAGVIRFAVWFPWAVCFRRGDMAAIERLMRRAAKWRGYVTVFDEVVDEEGR